MKTKSLAANLPSRTIRVLSILAIAFSFFATRIEQNVRAAGSVLYAASGGMTSGTCESWINACDLQYALSVSVPTNEIWVKQGIYKPTSGTDRTISFVLKDGVSLYGGFVGTETLRSQRASSASLTILSGDIGVSGDALDNSYHVVVASSVSNTTVVDGFKITLGYADGNLNDGFGAGMYNNSGSPNINNVIFDTNVALSAANTPAYSAGGGMYNKNGSPILSNSTFQNNSVLQVGLLDINGVPVDSIFGNSGDATGGGIYNEDSTITLSNVSFSNNLANSSELEGSALGGGIYNKNSTIIMNQGSLANNSANAPVLSLVRNAGDGGGIFNVDSVIDITDVTFMQNSAGWGGGMRNYHSNLTLNNVTFTQNSGAYGGGGILNNRTNTIISNSSFIGNITATNGGAIYNFSATDASNTMVLTKITFADNKGASALYQASEIGTIFEVSNVTFSNNEGYALYKTGSGDTANINHVTIKGNATGLGMAGNLNISNSIVWGNVTDVFRENGANNFFDSIISTGCPAGATCTNIITTDPKLGPLADNGGSTKTMALGTGSSAIDAGGKNSTCAASDQRGVTRPQGAGCDIGAYESLASSMLVNSVLPTSRSVQVGSIATIYHTVINPNANAVQNVTLSMVNAPAGSFAYQQTDCATNALTGSMNPTLDIPAGGMICYVLMFTPSAAFNAMDAYIRIESNAVPVSNLYPGINTWLLRATSAAGPDIIAQTTTADLHQMACTGVMAFAVATANVGSAATGDITVTANTGSASLPISVSIQETNPSTGAIIGDHILNNLGAGENRTVAVFVTFNGCVPFDPATNRIFIEFRDETNNILGSTSTAVSTNR